MQEFIARQNIQRFEEQLEQCSDEGQREVLGRLLEAERHHLAEILETKASSPASTAASGT